MVPQIPLSYRNLVEILDERGVAITRTTIMLWVHQYSPIIKERIRKYVKLTNDSGEWMKLTSASKGRMLSV